MLQPSTFVEPRHTYIWKQLHPLKIKAGFCEEWLNTEDVKHPLLPWWVLSGSAVCKYQPHLLSEICNYIAAFMVKCDIYTELQTPQQFTELIFINQ